MASMESKQTEWEQVLAESRNSLNEKNEQFMELEAIYAKIKREKEDMDSENYAVQIDVLARKM